MSENPYAGQGSVLLDIGGDVGALVVYMPASTTGLEVEIAPVGGPEAHHHRPHVAVVDRTVAGITVPSLVFPELPAGHYELFAKGSKQARLHAVVSGGEVTFADWPAVWGRPV